MHLSRFSRSPVAYSGALAVSVRIRALKSPDQHRALASIPDEYMHLCGPVIGYLLMIHGRGWKSFFLLRGGGGVAGI